MMKTRTIMSVGAAAFLLAFIVPPVQAQDADSLKSRAKELLKTHQDAVVHVKIALKQTMSFAGQELPGQDTQVEVTGTIIDPSGLVVVSDSEIDPMSFMMGMMGGMMGGLDGGGGIDSKSDVTDVKIVLKDGKEVPARLVLRDKDLDLAFVAPQPKDMKLPHIALAASKAPDLFDDLLVVRRLDRSLDRQPAIGLARVSAIVQKPRTFYVVDSAGSADQLGCPVFDRQGKAIGITVRRRGPASSGGGLGGLASMIGGMGAVVLPSEDVKEVAEQALSEAAKPSKKAEEKKGNEPESSRK
jgi:hypothetical protein